MEKEFTIKDYEKLVEDLTRQIGELKAQNKKLMADGTEVHARAFRLGTKLDWIHEILDYDGTYDSTELKIGDGTIIEKRSYPQGG
jgi:cobalamin biosynthesis Co2+ chelatase CbiK